MRLSVELVPRDPASLAAQLEELACLGRVDTVNVPDLAQFELRGWQAALQARAAGPWSAVPHFRAEPLLSEADRGWPSLGRLLGAGVAEVLVVSGDAVDADGRGAALAAIRALKAARPELKVYAALDPYRAGFAAELAYAEAKLAAGADGLFTQPFFDLRLLSVWQELTAGAQVFWGVTSVTSPRSQRYWLRRNRAVFPAGFEPTVAWHRGLAARVLDHVAASGGNLYFMPIKVGIGEWLGGLLD